MASERISSRDGKEAVSTTASLIGNIGKLILAMRILYAINEKFPNLFPKIKQGAQSSVDSMMKIGAVKKVADGAANSWQKFGEKFPKVTAGIKGTGSALGKIPGVIMSVTGGISRMEQITGLLLAIGAPAIAAGILAVGAAVVVAAGALAKFTASRFAAAAEIADFADVLESTTTRVQGLMLGAGAAGAKFEDVAGAVENIQKSVSKAITGNDEFAESFQRLGLDMNDLKRMSAEEIFLKISEGVRDGKVGAGNFAALLKVMGDEAKKLKPAMKDNLAGLSQMAEILAVGATDIQSLDDANKALGAIGTTLKGLLNLGVSKWVASFVKPITFWTKSETDPTNFIDDKDLDLNKKLEGKLAQKQSIRAAEAEELKAIREKNDEKEKEIRLEKMSAEEKKKALETERASLQAQMEGTKKEIEKEKLRKKILDVDEELARANKTDSKSERGEARQVDSLTRIGLFRGSSPTAMLSAIRQQINLQQRQLDAANQQVTALGRAVSELQQVRTELQREP